MVLAFENDLERISWATKLIDESSSTANDVPDGLGTSTHGSSMSGGGATTYGGAPQLSRSMGGWVSVCSVLAWLLYGPSACHFACSICK